MSRKKHRGEFKNSTQVGIITEMRSTDWTGNLHSGSTFKYSLFEKRLYTKIGEAVSIYRLLRGMKVAIEEAINIRGAR
jgi:hypothetical protein